MPTPGHSDSGKPLRVLIVEDSAADTELLLRVLRRGGYSPMHARVDSATAMQQALQEPWDIVIAEHLMPSFDSLEALRLAREKDTELPFILVSGVVGEDLAVEIMRAGAQDYIVKGNLARLVPAVERELREAEVRRERRRAEEALRESEERYRALVTELVELREELRAMSLVDDLTGLYNRRGFMILAEQQVRLAVRNGWGISVLVLDLDGLKGINDSFGCQRGDEALLTVAAALRGVCRSSDIIGRIGGDEFAVVAIGTSVSGAETLIQRLERGISLVNSSGERPYRLSVSVGAAHCDGGRHPSVVELLHQADGKMYEQKRSKSISYPSLHDAPPRHLG